MINNNVNVMTTTTTTTTTDNNSNNNNNNNNNNPRNGAHTEKVSVHQIKNSPGTSGLRIGLGSRRV